MSSDASNRARPVIVWFRSDLRLADNRALSEAVSTGKPTVCVYVLEETPARRPIGGAQKLSARFACGAAIPPLSSTRSLKNAAPMRSIGTGGMIPKESPSTPRSSAA
jgi:hypothetical protein